VAHKLRQLRFDGRRHCEACAHHSRSAEGHAAYRMMSLVYELAGYGQTPDHLYGRVAIPQELHVRDAYFQAYHDRGHLSYAELGLEDVPDED
jgi:hypothetical protein